MASALRVSGDNTHGDCKNQSAGLRPDMRRSVASRVDDLIGDTRESGRMVSLCRANPPLPCGDTERRTKRQGHGDSLVTPRRDGDQHDSAWVAADAKAEGERNSGGAIVLVKRESAGLVDPGRQHYPDQAERMGATGCRNASNRHPPRTSLSSRQTQRMRRLQTRQAGSPWVKRHRHTKQQQESQAGSEAQISPAA